MNMRYLLRLALCMLATGYCIAQATVLVVVENGYYTASKAKVDRYVSEIVSIERTPAELIVWNWLPANGSVRDQCYPLWNALQQRYVANRHVPATAADIEGAVFIGRLPVPMFRHVVNVFWNSGTNKYDTATVDFPHDYYFMDLWNKTTSSAYAIDTAVWSYHQGYQMFYSTNYESNDYKYYAGDARLDIWVTRVMAENLSHVRDGTVELTQNQILDRYLDRVHARMTAPASVPERSFSMSGITEWGTPPDNILNLDKLRLPFHARFQHPANNPANLVAQLQSGPLGNINYGGYYGTRYAAERNQRNCINTSLFNVTSGQNVYALDDAGYEWVGIFEHGSQYGFAFNGAHHVGDNSFIGLNGNFQSYNHTPMVDASMLITDAAGYNGKYYRFSNADFPVSPWGWGYEWRGRDAYWTVPLSIKGDYDVYMHYLPHSLNAENLTVRIDQNPINNSGSPRYCGSRIISQRAHQTVEPAGSNWEYLGRYSFYSYYDSAVVKLLTNGNSSGRFIFDAVKFVGVNGTGTQSITVVVDDQSPSFAFPDWYCRFYMDMQDEDMTTHTKYSKAQFFLTNSCHVNEYTGMMGATGNCMGLLFAMAGNGLISMGTVNSNYSNQNYTQFVDAIKAGKSFGAAFLEQANSRSFVMQNYLMFGAGTLHAKAYVTYGATMINDVDYSSTQDFNFQTPIHITNTTASETGNTTISAVREIRLLPETVLRQGANVQLMVSE